MFLALRSLLPRFAARRLFCVLPLLLLVGVSTLRAESPGTGDSKARIERRTPQDPFLRYWSDFAMTRSDFLKSFPDARLPPAAQSRGPDAPEYLLSRRNLPHPNAGAVHVKFQGETLVEVFIEFIESDVASKNGAAGFLKWINESIGSSGVMIGDEERPSYLWWGLDSKKGLSLFALNDDRAYLTITPKAKVTQVFIREIRDEIKRRHSTDEQRLSALIEIELKAGMIQEALADADSIHSAAHKSDALDCIAAAQAAAGDQAAALSTYDTALSQAQLAYDDTGDSWKRIFQLLDTYDLQIKAGRPAEASKTIERIDRLMRSGDEEHLQSTISDIGRYGRRNRMNLGKHSTALRAIELALTMPDSKSRSYSSSADVLVDIAKEALAGADRAAAEQTIRNAVAIAAKLPHYAALTIEQIAEAQVAHGHFQQSADSFQAAGTVEEGARSADNLINALAFRGDFDRAIYSAKTSKKMYSPYYLGVALAEAGKIDLALDLAKTNKPYATRLYHSIGRAQLRSGDREEAVRSFATGASYGDKEAVVALADLDRVDLAMEATDRIAQQWRSLVESLPVWDQSDDARKAKLLQSGKLLQAQTVIAVAVAYAGRGNLAGATRSLEVAKQYGERRDEKEKARDSDEAKVCWEKCRWAYFDYLLASKRPAEALEFSQGLPARPDQATGYALDAVVRTYARIGSYNAALRLIKSNPDDGEKASLLLSLADVTAEFARE
ncbi:MAG: hypothetical protein K8U03_25825 [Planctomycetia bacterium]|nr:hypothetical protein [Planctomycetia bacterium]